MDITTLLTDKDIEELKRRAMQELLKQVVANLHPGQIAAEIRNEAVKKAVAEISDKVFREKDIQATLQTAVNSAENRLNARLHKMLEKGVTVKFAGLEQPK